MIRQNGCVEDGRRTYTDTIHGQIFFVSLSSKVLYRTGGPLRKGKILCLITLFFLGGCNPKEEAQNIVHYNLGEEPHTLDPRCARDPNSQMVLRMLFDGLTRIAPNEEPELALAESVEISSDLKTYTFTLRNAMWSNGDPVRSSDFSYSWKQTLSPNFATDIAFQLYPIKNAKAVKEGFAPKEDLGIHTPDEKTLIVELEYPTPYFLQLVATPYFYPIHEKTDREVSNWAQKKETYVSNGPFLLEGWRHNDSILLRKNPLYFDEHHVELEGIEMAMVDLETESLLFQKKQLHFSGVPIDARAHFRDVAHVKPRDETSFLRINTKLVPLNDPKLRRALALAINRKDIVEHVTQGGELVAERLVPPSMQLQKEPYFADADKKSAKKLFDEVVEGPLPTFKYTYINSERSHLIAQAIQQQWLETLGLHIELEALERKVYFDRISKHDYDIAFCSWGADFHDPINFLEVFKYKGQSTNNTHWEDPTYARALDRSFFLKDPTDRKQLLASCEKLLLDAMPIIPIFHYTICYRQDENLQGIFLSSMGNLDFKWARLENGN